MSTFLKISTVFIIFYAIIGVSIVTSLYKKEAVKTIALTRDSADIDRVFANSDHAVWKEAVLQVIEANRHVLLQKLFDKSRISDDWHNYQSEFLRKAIWCGHVTVIQDLIEKSFDPTMRYLDGSAPLCEAAKYGMTDVVALLLDAGVYVNMRNPDGSTPLILACQGGHADIVRHLLDHRARVNLVDTVGESAIFHAIRGKHHDIVTMLIEADANFRLPNSNDFTPLMIAAEIGDIPTTRLLIEHDLNLWNKYGYRALVIAKQRDDVPLIRILEDEMNRLKSGKGP